MEFEAAQRRLEDGINRERAQAHLIATLQRAQKIPKVSDLLIQRPKSPEEERANLRGSLYVLAGQYGLTVRPVYKRDKRKRRGHQG